MIHPYQLHLLSKLYHEEVLHGARVRHIGHRAKAPRSRAGGRAGALVLARQLAAATVRLVRGQSAKSLKRERGAVGR